LRGKLRPMNRRAFVYLGLAFGGFFVAKQKFIKGLDLMNYELISWNEYSAETGHEVILEKKQYFLNNEAFLLDGFILESKY